MHVCAQAGRLFRFLRWIGGISAQEITIVGVSRYSTMLLDSRAQAVHGLARWCLSLIVLLNCCLSVCIEVPIIFTDFFPFDGTTLATCFCFLVRRVCCEAFMNSEG